MLRTYPIFGIEIETDNRSIMSKLSTVEVCARLNIARTTLAKWMFQHPQKIKFKARPNGKRMTYEIDEKEVERLENLMKKKREKGRPLIKSD